MRRRLVLRRIFISFRHCCATRHGLLRGALHLRCGCCRCVNSCFLCCFFLGIEYFSGRTPNLRSGLCCLGSSLGFCSLCAAFCLCGLGLSRVRSSLAASLCHFSSCLAALTLYLSLYCLCACLGSEAHRCCHQSGSHHDPFHRFYLSFCCPLGRFSGR